MNESQELPAMRCVARCSRCRLEVEFPLFLASFFTFATFYGVTTGTVYRLDEEFIHHGLCSHDAALAPAVAHEHGAQNVIQLPDHIFCPHCKRVVEGRPFSEIQQLGEIRISAVQLPLRAAA